MADSTERKIFQPMDIIELARETSGLIELFDDKVLNSDVYQNALFMASSNGNLYQDGDTLALVFGDSSRKWIVATMIGDGVAYREIGTGDQGSGFIRAGSVEKSPATERFGLQYYSESVSEPEQNTYTAVGNIRGLIAEFEKFSPAEVIVSPYRPQQS